MTGSGDGSGNGDDREQVRLRARVANPPGPADIERKRRLNGFLNHLIAYFAVMIIVTPINAALDPHYPWFLFPLIGWAAPVLLHLAYVLGWWGKKLSANERDGGNGNG